MAVKQIPSRRPYRYVGRLYVGLVIICNLAAFVVLLLMFAIRDYPYFIFDPSINTQYSADFSTERFQQIQIGDSKAHVLALIGEPLKTCERNNNCVGSYWTYSAYANRNLLNLGWFYYAIRFDVKDRVRAIGQEIRQPEAWQLNQ